MKKIISIVLATVLLALGFVSCGENPDTPKDTEKPEETEPASDIDPEILAAPAATQFTVSKAFGDNMVLQRNEPIRVWGFAKEAQNGRRVTVEFGGLKGAALIEDGHWMVTLDPLPESSEKRQIRVYGEENHEVTIEDVLVGDVFWVAGQSNIHKSVSEINAISSESAEGKSVKITNSDLIRLNRNSLADDAKLTQGTTEINEDVVVKRGWQKPEKGAPDFSAIGYFTAKIIYDRLENKIPIGLIEFDGNGMGLNSFCPNEVCDDLGIDYPDENGVYHGENVLNNAPSRFMYNHYMYAFQNMPICGIIWYQGESDCKAPNDTAYPERFAALITELRNRHNLVNHDYPVYVMEFPALYKTSIDFSSVRMYMGTIPNILSNVHLCQSSDFWKDRDYSDNLHPYTKWEQAERLAGIILADIYGIGDPEYVEGPSAESITFEDGGRTATVKFRNVGDGLRAEGGEIKGIKIKTASSWTEPESVEIVGKDTVKITAAKAIKSVGYNTARDNTFPEDLTLCNSEGIPCNAFIFNSK